ncbi:unnamed protein product [Arctia plantaginis]|uniref:Uncharacterized protein n=1 Tax=Arctia plantaginis TaxID=874455 RepID=A0A8S0Z1P9_ARCPL|nr:unnamed protein product [Arctia plantaginis]
MAGRVFCELHERLTPDRSRVLEVQQGKLTVLHVEWFDNSPKTTTLYQYGGAVALIPYVFGDEQGATTKIHIKNNNLLLYYVSEPFVDDNIDTFLMLFIYKCENQIIYIKIVYDPTVFNHNTLKVERTRQITCCPMKVQSNLKVKWDFVQGPNNCFTYEVTDHAGVFANVSPIPPDQVSKRAELTLLDPPKHKLIAIRVRTAKPLPGQPEPDYKHVVLRSAPAQARAPAQASASVKTGAIVMACTPATEPTPGPSSQD